MNRIYVLLFCFLVVLCANPDTELTEGYYVDASGADSIQVERSGNQITLSLENGSRINFSWIDKEYQYQKISSDDFLELKIETAEKFELIDNNNSVGVFTLYKTPSFFN